MDYLPLTAKGFTGQGSSTLGDGFGLLPRYISKSLGGMRLTNINFSSGINN